MRSAILAGKARRAESALNATTDAHMGTGEDDRARRGEKARAALQDFLTATTSNVR